MDNPPYLGGKIAMCKDICRISRIHIYFVEYADTQICLYRLTTIIRNLYFQRSLFPKYIIVLVQLDNAIPGGHIPNVPLWAALYRQTT